MSQEDSEEDDGSSGGKLCDFGPKWDTDTRYVSFGRSVLVDSAEAASEGPFPPNKVKTSKYTPFNFLCKNTFEQFHRMANVWFLLLSFFMGVGYYTPLFPGLINPWPILGTLVLMMTITAVSNALDDLSRHRADREMNQTSCRIACPGTNSECYEEKNWEDVVVGDLLIINNSEQIPADIVCLASAGNDGLCYVSTANLDGETNLKNKHAVEVSQEALCGQSRDLKQVVDRLLGVNGYVEAEPPDFDINVFNGKITFNDQLKPLGAEQVLLRGTVLRNTPWCVGVVVYTGDQTRMMMNARPAPLKQPTFDKLINRAVFIIIGMQALMALISTVLTEMTRSTFATYWYLQPLSTMMLPTPIGNWLAFFLLYSNLVPISLFSTIEACNFFQSAFINRDKEMYDPATGPAAARSRNLCQEPGQINYIFSDKTGTLTQNVMDFKQCSIAGKIYGEISEKKGFTGGEELRKARGGQEKEAVEAFLEVLGVAHTVIVDHEGKYEAESPDEAALVEAVAGLGYRLEDRAGHDMHVSVGLDGEAKVKTYTVLAVNSFTSKRARMSVLVKKENGEHWVMAKGADTKMLELAKQGGNYKGLTDDLYTFSCEGLRTLVLGRRKLDSSTAQSLVSGFEQAHLAQDKDAALERIAEQMEKDLDIVGATAIEDKLQEGVGETIENIRKAGIVLWVLTGDKLETARNIGFSCKVLSQAMEILVLEDASQEEFISDRIYQAEQAQDEGRTVAMMVTGAALKHVKEYEFDDIFLELASYCSVVIACRVAPLQKADMVRLVSEKMKTEDGNAPITLSVGDGANDVPMIQEAKVGVGIYGKEGRQAVNNADFAIGQFRFLSRLLFVHGRWNYIRTAKVVLFTFWRNAVLVLLMFFYTWDAGFSPVPLFEDIVRGTFNVVTFLPTVVMGIMDKDFEAEDILKSTGLYATGRRSTMLNAWTILGALGSAVEHSLLLYWIMLCAYTGLDLSDVGDVWTYGTIVYTCLMLQVIYRVIAYTEAWTWIFWLSIVFGCIVFYAVCLVVNSAIGSWGMLNFMQMYYTTWHMVSTPLFWICLLTVPAVVTVLDIFEWFIQFECPCFRESHVMKALKEAKKREESKEDMSEYEESFGEATKPVDRLQSHDSINSGYAFNHSGLHRHPSKLGRPDPVAVQTMLTPVGRQFSARESVDSYSRVDVDSDAASTASQDPGEMDDLVRNSRFFQQETFVCWNPMSSQRIGKWFCNPCTCTCTCSLLLALMLFCFAGILLQAAESTAQVTIHYDGTYERPWWHKGIWNKANDQMITTKCAVGETCSLIVPIPQDMKPPILVYYGMAPYYQNYFDYFNSVYWPELLGQKVEGKNKYLNKCEEPVRLTPQGQTISPCGIQAKSFFNDSFRIPAVTMDETGIAWDSDERRFQNPAGYPEPESPGWLYRRFNKTIAQHVGVKNEHFVTWMRPSAFNEVRKNYGFIQTPLTKGQNLSVFIDARYPVGQLGVRKELVLTTRSAFGGADETFAWFCCWTGIICLFVSLLTCCIHGVIQAACPAGADDDDDDLDDCEQTSE